MQIRTRRLALVSSTADLARAELRNAAELGQQLGVRMPDEWPPELYDDSAVRYWLDLLDSDPESAGWCSYYFVLHETDSPPVLIGAGGYKGKPRDGMVEIGYSIVGAYQRRGLASEAAAGLVENAFECPEVSRVIAETLPGLDASIGVLEKNGFRFIGDGSEPGVIRYELTRDDHVARQRAPL
ncbi:MAG TPA: GNAT family N-acetyltransferase [Gemmatimonadaceae bacterium]|nr:GNAT family N-acetyltransferase [Gemmatimonadaceae bacterium]